MKVNRIEKNYEKTGVVNNMQNAIIFVPVLTVFYSSNLNYSQTDDLPISLITHIFNSVIFLCTLG